MWSQLELSDVIEPNIKVCYPAARRHEQCGAPESQERRCAVEILQTFQRGPSQLHCLFSSAICQLCFEKPESPKLSKMWLPITFENVAQADQRQLLQGGTCPDFSKHFFMCEKQGHPLSQSLSSRDPIYMPSYPCKPWTTTHTLCTPWHHLEAISDLLLCHDITRDETRSKSWADTNLVMLRTLWLLCISAPQLFQVDRNKKIRGDVNFCQRSLLVCVTFSLSKRLQVTVSIAAALTNIDATWHNNSRYIDVCTLILAFWISEKDIKYNHCLSFRGRGSEPGEEDQRSKGSDDGGAESSV